MKRRTISIFIGLLTAHSLVQLSYADIPDAAELRKAVASVGLPMLLSAMANQEAENLPRRTNAHTEISTVQHIGKNREHLMYYAMRILTADVRGVSRKKIEEASRLAKGLDTKELCSSPVQGTLIKEYAVIYRFAYHDADMRFIHGFDIDRAACVEVSAK
jgi:hypothetical protein